MDHHSIQSSIFYLLTSCKIRGKAGEVYKSILPIQPRINLWYTLTGRCSAVWETTLCLKKHPRRF